MKTINEVIKALDYCLHPLNDFGNCSAYCPYISCCDPTKYDVTKDALFYLSYLYQILSFADISIEKSLNTEESNANEQNKK
jgi:hypothetical protein